MQVPWWSNLMFKGLNAHCLQVCVWSSKYNWSLRISPWCGVHFPQFTVRDGFAATLTPALRNNSHTDKSTIQYDDTIHRLFNVDRESDSVYSAWSSTRSVCYFTVDNNTTTAVINHDICVPLYRFIEENWTQLRILWILWQGQVLEQTLTWGVDSLIKVPPRFRTTAELVVFEDSFEGNFSVQSDVSGKVTSCIWLSHRLDENRSYFWRSGVCCFSAVFSAR